MQTKTGRWEFNSASAQGSYPILPADYVQTYRVSGSGEHSSLCAPPKCACLFSLQHTSCMYDRHVFLFA